MSVVTRLANEVKPRLRGQLHAVAAPLAGLAGALQIAFAPTLAAKLTSAVFCFGSVLLFGVSASYHTRIWSERTRIRLKRWDHANIFVLIACSYTPFAVLMLPSDAARSLLIVVWSGALLGAAFQILWVHAPRWLYVPIYVGLGWAALFWAGDFAAAGHPAVLALVILGGVFYTIGAVVYGLKRPDPAPLWFGFHEVFHTMTIAAFIAHYIGVWLLF
ncbi:MAG TPA: hemolysin III family protein [Kineosporiaceae bacterium]|nr:hemolysin III family protein [Kineosporiaceae bacterium]